ncbi:hypothetical protein GCM10010172_38270 [Paractinoplanes ferrugineus]|uniref:Uncharacterized protein n=1 Tax=Paractinoplanes ferrugineus TaxID=113564 RepID=A0A919MCF4_9ACTN|nr:hypothetical protein [Actinoplanes ferrugineus]GIE09424.1 hypothetical protein Afe05nite_12640 [Actinoplanes ferrugineus]
MSRRQLCGDLNGVRGLVAHGLARFEKIGAGSADFWVVSALIRVRGLDSMLVAAAGGLSSWSRTLISAAIAFPLLWSVAWTAHALGFAPAWVIVTTVLALGVAMPGLLWVTGSASRAFDRYRMGAPPGRRVAFGAGELNGEGAVSPGDGPAPGDTVVEGDLDEVAAALTRARVRLVSAALRQVDPERWNAAHLARLARQDRVLSRIADADLLLCQAIDFLELHAAEQAALRRNGSEQREPARSGMAPLRSRPGRPPQVSPERVGPAQNGPTQNGADRNGPTQNGADRNGADRNGADRNGADRNGADRSGTERRSV